MTIEEEFDFSDIIDSNQGGPVKPIIVTDPNDPRLKAYNDSLYLYNDFVNSVNEAKNVGKKFIGMSRVFPDAAEYGYGKQGYTNTIDVHKKPIQPIVYQNKAPVINKSKIEVLEIDPIKRDISIRPPNIIKSKLEYPKEDKIFFQGSDFIRKTGQRPGWYTPEEVSYFEIKNKWSKHRRVE